MSDVNIEHTGRVKEKKGNTLVISIIPHSACVSCSVSGACSESSTQEKLIEIIDYSGQYELGETVDVYYAQSLGFQALFLGYILPFLLLLITLIISYSLTNNEGLSGLLSLGVLIPYYLALYIGKDKIRQKFTFQIKPKDIMQKVKFAH